MSNRVAYQICEIHLNRKKELEGGAAYKNVFIFKNEIVRASV